MVSPQSVGKRGCRYAGRPGGIARADVLVGVEHARVDERAQPYRISSISSSSVSVPELNRPCRMVSFSSSERGTVDDRNDSTTSRRDS